jgi:hypothetical protein
MLFFIPFDFSAVTVAARADATLFFFFFGG